MLIFKWYYIYNYVEKKEKMEELVFDEKFLKIYLNKKSSYLRLVWIGFVSDKNYQLSLDSALEFVKDHGLLAWIADLKDMKVISIEN